MKESDLAKRLLNLDSGNSPAPVLDRELARRVVQKDRRHVWTLAALASLFWLLAAIGVFFVVYAAVFHLYPKQHQLMTDAATGALPVAHVIEIQSLHFRAVEICTLAVAAAFVAATLAVGCTIGLVLVSRRATMRHINTNLIQILELLQKRQPEADNSRGGNESH
jgi:hypothetical protein